MEAHASQMDHPVRYDGQKIQRIRERIREVFGRESAMNDEVLSKRYNITPDGDLIMIIR